MNLSDESRFILTKKIAQTSHKHKKILPKVTMRFGRVPLNDFKTGELLSSENIANIEKLYNTEETSENKEVSTEFYESSKYNFLMTQNPKIVTQFRQEVNSSRQLASSNQCYPSQKSLLPTINKKTLTPAQNLERARLPFKLGFPEDTKKSNDKKSITEILMKSSVNFNKTDLIRQFNEMKSFYNKKQVMSNILKHKNPEEKSPKYKIKKYIKHH